MSRNNILSENINEAAFHLKVLLKGRTPHIGIILGSGWGVFADSIENPIVVAYKDIPHMRSSTVPGHAGQFVCGMIGDVCVLAMQGRIHGYEGYSSPEVAFPVWMMGKLGIDTLIVTNASGALNPAYHPGDFCVIKDHINATGRNPLAGIKIEGRSHQFVSMLDAYDPRLTEIAREAAVELDITLHPSIYVGVLGPSFETPAEVRLYGSWGGDIVAMSICEEVIAARHAQISVLGLSFVSNMGCGINNSSPSHEEVAETSEVFQHRAFDLLCSIVEKIEKQN